MAALLAVAALGVGGALLVSPPSGASPSAGTPETTMSFPREATSLEAAPSATTVEDHDGNDNGALTCSGDLVKIDGGAPAVIDGIQFTTDGTYLSFHSTVEGSAVSFVSVKGGDAYRVYTFDPPATAASGLSAPLNGGGNVPAISHYTVCLTVVSGGPTTTPSTTTPATTAASTTAPATTAASTTAPATTAATTTTPVTTAATTSAAATTTATPGTTQATPTTAPVTSPVTTATQSTLVSPPEEGAETTVIQASAPSTAVPATVVQAPGSSTTVPLVITELPRTGGHPMTTILVAIGLLVAGGALVLLTRMRAGDPLR